MQSQNLRLLAHLKTGASIQPLQALSELSIFRLASRINDLKNQGYIIDKTMIDVTNRFNETVKVANYRLTEEVQ